MIVNLCKLLNGSGKNMKCKPEREYEQAAPALPGAALFTTSGCPLIETFPETGKTLARWNRWCCSGYTVSGEKSLECAA